MKVLAIVLAVLVLQVLLGVGVGTYLRAHQPALASQPEPQEHL